MLISQQLDQLAKAALLAVMRAHAYPRVHHPCGGGHPDGGAGQDPSKDYRERLFQPPEQSGRARGHASRLTLSGLCAARGFRNTSRSTTKASLDRSAIVALPYRKAMPQSTIELRTRDAFVVESEVFRKPRATQGPDNVSREA